MSFEKHRGRQREYNKADSLVKMRKIIVKRHRVKMSNKKTKNEKKMSINTIT